MGLRILYGTSQTALLEACIDGIDGTDASPAGSRALLLVPEQTKAEAERLYLERTGRTGILLAEVLSFSRLAYRIQGEIGGLSRTCVDGVGKSVLLHTLLKENRDRLQALAAGAGRPGFVPQVGQVLGDLRRYGVEPGQLQEAAREAAGEDRPFAAKAGDLAFLMEAYAERMRGLGLYDREDDLWRLAETLEALRGAAATDDAEIPWPLSRAAFLASASVWVTGFAQTREFTPQEYAVLDGLAGVCARVTVTVCADGVPGDDDAVASGPDAFRIGRQTAYRLAARHPGTRAERVPHSLPGVFARIARGILGDRVLTPDGVTPWEASPSDAVPGEASPAGTISGEEAPSPAPVTTALFRSQDDEIRWVAGEIRRLTLTGGYRYGDIAVGVSNPSAYLSPLRAVFREFGLSPFIDEPRPLSGTPLYRFIKSLLDLKVHDWSLPAITACLRSDFCRIGRGEADRLENFLLARGLTGAGRVFDDRRYRAEYDALAAVPPEEEAEAEPDPDEVRAGRGGRRTSGRAAAREARMLRDRVLVPLRIFLDRLAAEPGCAGKCRLLTDFLAEYGVRDAVSARAESLRAEGEDEAAVTLVRAWNGIANVMEQTAAIAGNGAYGMEEFRDALAAGMEGAESGAIPPVIDRITVSGYSRAGFRRARALFLIGASEESFPSSAPPEGLLKDPDRERLSARLGIRLPSVLRDQVFADAALSHALLTAPSDRLYMTAPVDRRPASGTMDILRRLIPDGIHFTAGPPEAADPRVAAVRPARCFLLAAASDPTLPGDPGRLTVLRALADTLGMSGGDDAGRRWLGWIGEDRAAVRLPAALVREAAGRDVRMSVSQLENYASCPYAYLSRYLLRLQDREVWTPLATDTGSMLHGILELAVRGLSADLAAAEDDVGRQAVFERWCALDFEAFAEACMREIAERDGYGLFFDAGIRASGGRRVRRLGSASLGAVIGQLASGDAVPLCTEWRFGTDGPGGFTLHVQGTDITFRGVVDRVDRVGPACSGAEPAGGFFRIVDYKSGDVSFDPDKVFYGLSLQLPAYAAAYGLAHPGARAAELAYFRFQAPMAACTAHEGRPDDTTVGTRIARQFQLRETGLGPDAIAEVTAHTVGRMDALCGALLSGKADARPARIGSAPAACRYCTYQAVCGHEGKLFFHMKPLAERIPREVESHRMRRLLVAIRDQADKEGGTDGIHD